MVQKIYRFSTKSLKTPKNPQKFPHITSLNPKNPQQKYKKTHKNIQKTIKKEITIKIKIDFGFGKLIIY
jgi:hypothetical protein